MLRRRTVTTRYVAVLDLEVRRDDVRDLRQVDRRTVTRVGGGDAG